MLFTAETQSERGEGARVTIECVTARNRRRSQVRKSGEVGAYPSEQLGIPSSLSACHGGLREVWLQVSVWRYVDVASMRRALVHFQEIGSAKGLVIGDERSTGRREMCKAQPDLQSDEGAPDPSILRPSRFGGAK